MRKSTKSFTKEIVFNGLIYPTTVNLSYENVTDVKVKVDIELPDTNQKDLKRTISGEDLFNERQLTTKAVTYMILELIQHSSSSSQFETDLMKELDGTLSF
ncbi:hypothetical protein AAGG74_16650 [Bacillus mexicanus]|uniref:hypothetical protein n=1 Tax=Bacillus mexicanus TaxID=2834415 RepID=UPI003D1FF0DE